MLVVSYIVVYGDYFMWFDTLRIRLLFGAAIVLSGIVLYRLRYYRYPYIELGLYTSQRCSHPPRHLLCRTRFRC